VSVDRGGVSADDVTFVAGPTGDDDETIASITDSVDLGTAVAGPVLVFALSRLARLPRAPQAFAAMRAHAQVRPDQPPERVRDLFVLIAAGRGAIGR